MGSPFPQLTLSCQLTDPEPVEPENSLARRMELRGDMFTTQLTATQSTAVFPEHPLEKQVYILVQRPRTSELKLSYHLTIFNQRSTLCYAPCFLPQSP